jgi:hypothetical protein
VLFVACAQVDAFCYANNVVPVNTKSKPAANMAQAAMQEREAYLHFWATLNAGNYSLLCMLPVSSSPTKTVTCTKSMLTTGKSKNRKQSSIQTPN